MDLFLEKKKFCNKESRWEQRDLLTGSLSGRFWEERLESLQTTRDDGAGEPGAR